MKQHRIEQQQLGTATWNSGSASGSKYEHVYVFMQNTNLWKLGPPRNICEAGDHVEQEEQKLEIFGQLR